jgi:hypothetical protein
LVEQRPFKAWVLGSSPSGLTTHNQKVIEIERNLQNCHCDTKVIHEANSPPLDTLTLHHLPGGGDIEVSTRQLPEVGQEHYRSSWEVCFCKTVFDLLAKQSEKARLNKARQDGASLWLAARDSVWRPEMRRPVEASAAGSMPAAHGIA